MTVMAFCVYGLNDFEVGQLLFLMELCNLLLVPCNQISKVLVGRTFCIIPNKTSRPCCREHFTLEGVQSVGRFQLEVLFDGHLLLW